MSSKLLIINKAQFGYHTDSYKYCQYLKNEFDITYICFDTHKPKIYEDNVKVIYVPYVGSFFKKGLNFISFCRKHIDENSIDLVFVVYFQMSSLVRYGKPADKFILDIRTGAVGKNKIIRSINDFIMVLESKSYKYITIISDSLVKRLNLKDSKCHILPLAADVLSSTDKLFKKIKLMYIGTLSSRNIEETVEGLSIFIEKMNIDKSIISYDIFGSGTKEEENLLEITIKKRGLESIVKFHGRKTHHEVQIYFDNCNIGVSYVPLVDYYECQPPTKVFEYVKSGMYTIATSTHETTQLLNHDNGILCEDNAESFSLALEYIYTHMGSFSSHIIRKSFQDYSWDNIVNNNLKKYIEGKII